MKKWTSILVTVLLVLSMTTAFAAVPSKTTTNTAAVTTITSVSGAELAETFKVTVAEADDEDVVKEIQKIYTFVSDGNAPVEYFPVEVKEQIVAKLPETIVAADVEINEFVTIDQTDYEESYGDVKASFRFTTVYAPEQSLVAVVGIFTGEVAENGEPIVEWIVLDAVANEDGTVEVTFTADAMLKIQNAATTSLAIINTPAVETEAVAE